MATNAYWAFCHFMAVQASGSAEAAFWFKVLAFWPFLDAFMLHFALVFTESDLLKNKLTYVVLYFPALFFTLIDLTTNLISTYIPILQTWGYVNPPQIDSILSSLYGVWSGIFSLLVLFCFARYYHKVVDNTKKRQTEFIIAGFAIPIVVSLFTDSLYPALGIAFPVMGPIFGSLTSIFVVYAMIKYDLFSFRAEIAIENVFSAMPDSAMLASLKGTIIKVNRSLLEVSGYAESELIGKSVFELVNQANVLSDDGKRPDLTRLKVDREVRNHEVTFNTKSGECKAATLSSSVVIDNNGNDVGYAFVLHDITKRKLMEQKLLQAERFASIGELATILGHDLRNPLSGIRGATFFLRRKHSNVWDQEDLAMFESIDKSIDYSNKIINDLLDYSREIRLDLAAVTPKSLLKETLMLLAVPQDVQIIDETSDQLSFYADTVKVCRVFVNVVKNAVDAMPEGGRLTVKSEVLGEFVEFTFSDTGVGMSAETLERISTPLFTTKAKGMGFGLAICRRFVEAHGGCVSVDSMLGEGTTVRVDLPLFLDMKTEK
jgi:PAS domain S-box